MNKSIFCFLTNQNVLLEKGSGCWRCCSDGGSRGGRFVTSCVTRELQDESQVRNSCPPLQRAQHLWRDIMRGRTSLQTQSSVFLSLHQELLLVGQSSCVEGGGFWGDSVILQTPQTWKEAAGDSMCVRGDTRLSSPAQGKQLTQTAVQGENRVKN